MSECQTVIALHRPMSIGTAHVPPAICERWARGPELLKRGCSWLARFAPLAISFSLLATRTQNLFGEIEKFMISLMPPDVARPQQFPLRPLWVMELFQLGLHLCLRSQWLRPHPHTSARRLRPWCTLPCKLRVHVYTLCLRYYCLRYSLSNGTRQKK